MAHVQAPEESGRDVSALDPLDWTVDQVVDALCSPSSPYLNWGGGVTLPEGFANILREEQIDGEALLTTVTMESLRNDLGIKALGARTKILNLVHALQYQSPKFRGLEWRAAHEYRLSSVPPIGQYCSPHVTKSQISGWIAGNLASELSHDQHSATLRRQCGPASLSPNSLLSPTDARAAAETPSRTFLEAVDETEPKTTDLAINQHESTIVDRNGRQRRRLAPTIVTEKVQTFKVTQPNALVSDEPQQEPQPSTGNNLEDVFYQPNEQQSLNPLLDERFLDVPNLKQQDTHSVPTGDPSLTAQSSGKVNDDSPSHPKRAKPTLIQTTVRDVPRKASPTPATSTGLEQAAEIPKATHSGKKSALGQRPKRASHQICYGPTAFPVDEIFYSDLALEEGASDEPPTLKTEQQEFSFDTTRQFSDAQRLWVHSRMKYFLGSTSSKLIVNEERGEVGIIPYPKRLGKKHFPLSMTVLSWKEHGITKIRTDRSDWMEIASRAPDPNAFSVSDPSMVMAYNDDNFDTLEKWNHLDGDKVFPVYGESDSEEDYDSQTYAEIEAENREKQSPKGSSRKPKLTGEEVKAAIDDAIKRFCEDWQTKQRPKMEHEAWRLWTRAEHDCTTKLQIEETVSRLANLEGRILNLRTEMCKEEWFKVTQVMKQCNSIHPSIFEREQCQWKLDILQSPFPPQKLPTPASKRRTTKATQKPTQSAEDGTDCVCSAEAYSETEDDLDDFIVDDEVEGVVEPQVIADDEDANTADEEDINLSDTLLNSPSPALMDREEQSHQNSNVASPAVADPSQKPMSNVIDLTQASDSSQSSTPAKAAPPRISTPPIINEEEDSDAWFVRTRSIKAEFKHPPKIEDAPVIIDLVNDSESKRPIMPPPPKKLPHLGTMRLNPTKLVKKQNRKLPKQLPHLNDIQGIMRLDPSKFVEKQDRKRLLRWLVGHTNEQKRDRVMEYLHDHERACHTLNTAGLNYMQAGRDDIMKKGLFTSNSIRQVAAWFVGWTIPVKLDSKGIHSDHFDAARQVNEKGFYEFLEFLLQTLEMCKGLTSIASTPRKRKKKNSGQDGETSDTSTIISSRPSKKNKKQTESQETLQKRGAALQRMHEDTQGVQQRAERDKRRKELMPRLEALAILQTEASEVILNPGKLEDDDLIRMNPEFGRGAQLKPHQKDGLQFMWREITGDHENLQGCLLAQTMGLGKTIQVIALLVAISDAANSPSERLRNQVPADLRPCQTLVLCPPALIENWWDEFLMWPPVSNHLGELRKVSSSLSLAERISEILAWAREGGILLLGYTTFRDLIQNTSRHLKTDKAAGLDGRRPLNEKDHEQVKTALLEKPNIVVADEAHEFKNPKSQISMAINQIKCKSRIALTGSPLSNNLTEYFATIDWISPGYLGSEPDFKSAYESRIQQGLQEDATAYQYRESRKRLKALELELEPKVHRANLSALHNNLHGKSEFVVRVPLTAFQDRLYRSVLSGTSAIFEESDRPKSTKSTKSTKTLGYIAILQLICNHPKCFLNEQKQPEATSSTDPPANRIKGKSGSRGGKKNGQSTQQDPTSPDLAKADEDPMDNAITADVLSRAAVDTQEAFGGLEESIDALMLSNKMQALMRIIELSGAAGDKVLVFSHRMSTLDYVENQLNILETAFCRIDGKVKADKRQNITKAFNEGSDAVCLISTRAGGQGLNISGANRVVILDSHFNPMWEQQAIGRAYRIGQQKHVYIYRLTAAGTFEEEMQSQGLFKEQLATRVLEKQNPHRVGGSGSRDYLFNPKKVTKCDVTCFEGKDPKVLDHLLANLERIPIVSITPSETFYVDDGQHLTAQELREAQQIQQHEKLHRTDPKKFHATHYPAYASRHALGPGDAVSSASKRAKSVVGNEKGHEAGNPIEIDGKDSTTEHI